MLPYPFLWNQHYDYWRTVAYLATMQVICNYTVHPAVAVAIISGETNDFVKQSYYQYFIRYEHLCINSPPKAGMQWFVKKIAVGC